MAELEKRHCVPCEGGVQPYDADKVREMLGEVKGWEANDEGTVITRMFRFKDHYQTVAFVNAVAWISHQEDHHPEMEVGYSRCVIHYSTHAIGGLSENDFICAAKVDALTGD
jgi:4a-hydroxytetrahydrobiopterin dehydratase